MADTEVLPRDDPPRGTTAGIELRDFASRPPGPEESQGSESKPTKRWYRWRGDPFAVDVSHQACRDHFALERTFLAFIRTANAFAQVGVATAWLFRIQVDGSRDTTALRIGNAIGAATVCVAILVALCGLTFFMQQQKSVVKGTIIARPWTNWIILVLSMAMLCALFVLLLVSDTWHELARNGN